MEQFEKLADGTTEASVDTGAKKKSGAKKNTAQIEKFVAKLKADPTLKETLRSLSDSLMVVNSLAFSDDGSIVVDPTKQVDENGKRPLIKTSKIVG